MSDITTTSCCNDNKCDNGLSPILMIFVLLFLCGGDNGIFGCGNGNSSCSCNSGLNGILPILLPLFLCGGFNF
jgi:hypothetical protein